MVANKRVPGVMDQAGNAAQSMPQTPTMPAQQPPTDDPITRRNPLLPVVEHQSGQREWGMPGLIQGLMDLPGQIQHSMTHANDLEMDPETGRAQPSQQLIGDNADIALNVGLGGFAAPKPAGALAANGGKGTLKGARPEPSALIPKAEAMGPSSVLAKTEDDYGKFLKGLQEDPQSTPTIGMPTPGVDPNAVRSAYEDGLRRWHRGFSKYSETTPDPYGPLNGPLGDDLPAVMDALNSAARAAGRSIDQQPRFAGSQYGTLNTPTGDRWSVRVADHGNQSQHYGESDFNIAPGAMSVDEFLGALPTIYANGENSAKTALALDAISGQRKK